MYINLLPDDGYILKYLKENIDSLKQFIISIPDEKLNFRYELNKWLIKEILQHIIDDERIFAYRAPLYHLAGHELQHINIIKEKYLILKGQMGVRLSFLNV